VEVKSGNKTFISTPVDPLLLVACAKKYYSQVKYISYYHSLENVFLYSTSRSSRKYTLSECHIPQALRQRFQHFFTASL